MHVVVKADLGNFRTGLDDRAVPLGIGDVMDAKRRLDCFVIKVRHDIPHTCSNMCGSERSFVRWCIPKLGVNFLGYGEAADCYLRRYL